MFVLAANISPVSAASDNLRAAADAYAQLDYERVRPLAQAALSEELDPGERVTALELLACLSAIEGETDAAQAYFVTLLRLDGSYDLPPSASPKLRAPLHAAREEEAKRHIAPPTVQMVPTQPIDTSAPLGAGTTPFYRRPVFWVGVAAAALLTTVITIAATRDTRSSHDFGPYEVLSAQPAVIAW